MKILGGDEWRPHRHPSDRRAAGQRAPRQPHRAPTPRSTRPDRPSARRVRDRGAGSPRARARCVAGLTGRRPDRGNALSGELSQQRRVVGVETRLADYRTIRDAHGGTVNDVILATLTGALRAWLMTRAESMGGLRQIQAVVPVSVIDRELEATSLGSQIAAALRRPSRSPRPARWSGCTRSPTPSRPTRRPAARSPPTGSPGIAGFAPTTFHAIGSRVAAAELRRGFQLSITNVPGPQSPLYAAGARMVQHLPDPAAAAGPDARDRRDVVRRPGLLRHHRRPRPGARRRRPRPVRDRGARPSCSTPRPAAGRRSRAAGARRPRRKP